MCSLHVLAVAPLSVVLPFKSSFYTYLFFSSRPAGQSYTGGKWLWSPPMKWGKTFKTLTRQHIDRQQRLCRQAQPDISMTCAIWHLSDGGRKEQTLRICSQLQAINQVIKRTYAVSLPGHQRAVLYGLTLATRAPTLPVCIDIRGAVPGAGRATERLLLETECIRAKVPCFILFEILLEIRHKRHRLQ